MKYFLSLMAVMAFTSPKVVATVSNQTLLNDVYKKAYSQAAINCEYYYFRDVPRVETIAQNFSQVSGAQASFRIKNNILSVGVEAGDSNGVVSFDVNGTSFSGKLLSSGKNKVNHIELNLSSLNQAQSQIARDLKLSDLDCSVDIGMEPHFKLSEEQVHINMHPHINYDLDGESIPGMLRELAKPSQQIMLFDDSPNSRFGALAMNFNSFMNQGTYLARTSSYAPPRFTIPVTIPMRLSQAGHSRYILTQPHHEITYTGGNHNFCILNNTRRVLHGFMESELSSSIKFKFPMDAIVVQKYTWLEGGKFSRRDLKKSNMLSRIFKSMSSKSVKKYLDSYYNYFRYNYFAEKQYYYQTITFKQVGAGYSRTETISGRGQGHLEVVFEYLD